MDFQGMIFKNKTNLQFLTSKKLVGKKKGLVVQGKFFD
jgi:hypothetical protein